MGFAVCLGHTAKILFLVVIEKAIVLVSLRKENTKVELKRKVKLERTNVWYTRFKRKRMVLLKKKSVSKLEEKRFCNLHIPYGNTLHHKENAT